MGSRERNIEKRYICVKGYGALVVGKYALVVGEYAFGVGEYALVVAYLGEEPCLKTRFFPQTPISKKLHLAKVR
jgi:hypothetical protein